MEGFISLTNKQQERLTNEMKCYPWLEDPTILDATDMRNGLMRFYVRVSVLDGCTVRKLTAITNRTQTVWVIYSFEEFKSKMIVEFYASCEPLRRSNK